MMMLVRWRWCRWALVAGLFAGAGVLPAATTTWVLLENGDLSAWESQTFEKVERHTQYRVVDDATEGRVVEAVAMASSSGFILNRPLPFTDAATLTVRWKVLAASNSADEKTKAGDDMALRVYLVSRQMVKYRTLILVVSSQYAAGESWVSPYDGFFTRFQMHVMGGPEHAVGQWHTATIPLAEVWGKRFGTRPPEFDGIAFMVDADNAGGRMVSRLGGIEYQF